MTTPAAELHQREAEVFARVCELPPHARAAALDVACGDDAPLRRGVERLFLADAQGSGVLDSPAVPAGLRALADDLAPVPGSLPDQIGPFRVLSLLGRGGMGVVYLAEQDRLRRQVALKVVRAGLATPRNLRRFENEAEALARLQHPSIARIYETGVYHPAAGPNGDPPAWAEARPYLAMEVVHGRPITGPGEPAATDARTVRQRLELFLHVCDAVQHAHSKGVIHRDLKPSNILVDETGVPKVLDFGIARLTQPDSRAEGGPAPHSLATEAGQLIGTLQYMSPEQAAGRHADIDTRTDIYSLGLILYELLAGRPAFDLASVPFADAISLIQHRDPPRLSFISRVYRGDLETIVAKALAPEPEARYQTADELADDLKRLLTLRPIRARPVGLVARGVKFLRRNRSAGAVLAVLVVLSVSSALVAVRESRHRRTLEKVQHDLQTALGEATAFSDAMEAAASFGAQLAYIPFDIERWDRMERILASVGSHDEPALRWATADQALTCAIAGMAYARMHRTSDAVREMSEGINLWIQRWEGERNVNLLTLEVLTYCARALAIGDRTAAPSELAALCEQLVARWQEIKYPADYRATGQVIAAEGLISLGRWTEAESVLLLAEQGLRDGRYPGHHRRAIGALIRVYGKVRDEGKADYWRGMLRGPGAPGHRGWQRRHSRG